MGVKPGRRGLFRILIAAIAGLGSLVVVVALIWGNLDVADRLASVLGALIAVASLAVSLWADRSAEGDVPPASVTKRRYWAATVGIAGTFVSCTVLSSTTNTGNVPPVLSGFVIDSSVYFDPCSGYIEPDAGHGRILELPLPNGGTGRRTLLEAFDDTQTAIADTYLYVRFRFSNFGPAEVTLIDIVPELIETVPAVVSGAHYADSSACSYLRATNMDYISRSRYFYSLSPQQARRPFVPFSPDRDKKPVSIPSGDTLGIDLGVWMVTRGFYASWRYCIKWQYANEVGIQRQTCAYGSERPFAVVAPETSRPS